MRVLSQQQVHALGQLLKPAARVCKANCMRGVMYLRNYHRAMVDAQWRGHELNHACTKLRSQVLSHSHVHAAAPINGEALKLRTELCAVPYAHEATELCNGEATEQNTCKNAEPCSEKLRQVRCAERRCMLLNQAALKLLCHVLSCAPTELLSPIYARRASPQRASCSVENCCAASR